jgi:hypothetical protein
MPLRQKNETFVICYGKYAIDVENQKFAYSEEEIPPKGPTQDLFTAGLGNTLKNAASIPGFVETQVWEHGHWKNPFAVYFSYFNEHQIHNAELLCSAIQFFHGAKPQIDFVPYLQCVKISSPGYSC